MQHIKKKSAGVCLADTLYAHTETSQLIVCPAQDTEERMLRHHPQGMVLFVCSVQTTLGRFFHMDTAQK